MYESLNVRSQHRWGAVEKNWNVQSMLGNKRTHSAWKIHVKNSGKHYKLERMNNLPPTAIDVQGGKQNIKRLKQNHFCHNICDINYLKKKTIIMTPFIFMAMQICNALKYHKMNVLLAHCLHTPLDFVLDYFSFSTSSYRGFETIRKR